MANLKELKEKTKNISVLFVDDELSIREGMGAFLGKFFDHVTVCVDGEDGLNEFRNNPNYDVVITDLLMPKMSGIEMIKQIRHIMPDVKPIYITASISLVEDLHEREELVYKKPISFDDMLDIIKNIV